jgi:hypothetical protein
MKGNLSIDRESVRLLAIELGVREAARRCGLSEDRVRKWSSRYKWLEQRAPKQQEAAVTVVTTPGDVLLQEHKALESTTKSALMQTAAKAAVSAAQKPALDVSNTAQFRDLAASAARIFGWDKGPQTAVQVNAGFKLTMEQLEEIRALCDSPLKKAAICEGDERKNNEH